MRRCAATAFGLLEQDPREAAASLAEAAQGRPAWLATFTGELEARATSEQLPRLLRTWGLSSAEAARIFGISRQGLAKWSRAGVPAEHRPALGDLAAATDLLVHYLKPDRIPAVVRRPASALANRSLVDLAMERDTAAVLAACRAMFDFAAITA